MNAARNSLLFRSGLASLLATSCDVAATSVSARLGVGLPFAAIAGVAVGAAVNFLLQRRAFGRSRATGRLGRQAAAYLLVAGGALVLNPLLTTLAGVWLPVAAAKLLACGLTFVVFTHPVSRHVVFA